MSAACPLLSHSTDCKHTDSRIANSKHYHLPDVSHSVSSLHLLESTAEIHRCGQACRQKLLASTSCSMWLHHLNGVSAQTNLSNWQHFYSVVIASGRTTRGSPGALHLDFVHNPCTVPNHAAHQHMIRSNFCLVSH